MEIDLLGPEPLYEQIADVVAERIRTGEYEVRRAIPSAARLCEEFGVSRKTIGMATALLRDRGLVEGRPGKGVYVTAKPPAAQ